MAVVDRFRLRMEPGQDPELRCPHCGEWWAITLDHWDKNEWHMCLPCKRDRAKLYQRLRMRDAQYRDKQAEKSRRYRGWLKATYPQYLQAYDREKRARNREKARLYRISLKETA